jgi:diphosphomevalonate decarboxylase
MGKASLKTVSCTASPSLALVKYWGKRDTAENIPATPSLAVTLGGLRTETEVSLARGSDSVILDGNVQEPGAFEPFFRHLRIRLDSDARFHVESRSNFPGAAGLASSSSGFAALTCACARLLEREMTPSELSEIARFGSASAARSVYGGFTLLEAGRREAEAVFPAEHWPDFRIVLAVTTTEKKSVSSRWAMENTRMTSPYYGAWLRSSADLLPVALEALKRRDLDELGRCARLSYMRMHAAIMASDPPLAYWLPATLAVIRECESLRADGIGAWETIDAGPQVKILCAAGNADEIASRVEGLPFGIRTMVAEPGEAPECRVVEK